MTVRSILEIDLRDSSFQRFTKQFDAYQKALKTSPAEWAKVTANIGRSRKEFDDLVKAQIASQARGKLIAEAQREAERLTRSSADRWRDISRSTASIAGNIRRATGDLVRWGAATGVVSGLLGAGGLFGLNSLAGNVSGTRRSALGLGTGYGELKSFGANFGRLVDPDSFLSSVANAKLDLTKRTGLYGAGLTEGDIGGSTASVSVALLQKLKDIADRTDPRLYGQTLAARNLGQHASPEDLQRLRNTSQAEFNSLKTKFGQGSSAFDLSDKNARLWQDFYTQLHNASEGIENTFVKGLVRLTPGLEKLSISFEKVVRALLDNEVIGKWLDKVNSGFEKLAKYIGTDDFEKSVQEFVHGVGEAARAIVDFVKWVGGNTRFGGLSKEDEKAESDRSARVAEKRKTLTNFFNGGYPIGSPVSDVEAYIREAAIKRKIDPNVAVAVAKSEGLYGYTGDQGTSFGPFQLHYKNNIPGLSNAGMGDDFTKATGLHARDPSTVNRQVDYALDRAMKEGWGAWHGFKGDSRAGLPNVKITVDNSVGSNLNISTKQVAQ